ncbi:hypothetical protein PITC_019570 [Penicillium italicum]|uniref:Uncharacterized protein n=1 Tax=Penicillium italicum TaxID=40296 RepID=A0A0A2L334_PENIT|nr:hypothetical protein PITC_019570 [Penicillium italicum]
MRQKLWEWDGKIEVVRGKRNSIKYCQFLFSATC